MMSDGPAPSPGAEPVAETSHTTKQLGSMYVTILRVPMCVPAGSGADLGGGPC
jgi:hypothetical protein